MLFHVFKLKLLVTFLTVASNCFLIILYLLSVYNTNHLFDKINVNLRLFYRHGQDECLQLTRCSVTLNQCTINKLTMKLIILDTVNLEKFKK